MPRRSQSSRTSTLISLSFVVILCLIISYFSYQLFFRNLSLDHTLARNVISLGIPVVGEQEEFNPGWEYTLRSMIYLMTDYDLGNPEILLKNTIPLLPLFEQIKVWEQRPFVFIPELSFAPDPILPEPDRELVLEPKVLIYHTHSSEMYLGAQAAQGNYHNSHYVFSSNNDSKVTGIMEVGNHLAQALQQQGIGVIHNTTIHDWPSLTNSYINSERTAKEILAANKGIRFVFDVHRDANVPDRVLMVNGNAVAKVLIVMGTAEDIPQSHPHWRQNLAFAQQFYQIAERMYPGLMRPIQIRKDARYNQHLHVNSILLEIGTVENTIEEALLAAELVATVIAEML